MLLAQHPGMTITLTIGNTEKIIHELNKFNVAIGLIEGNCHVDNITKSIWQDDELVVIASAKHPLAKKKTGLF
ncbi:MAG: hypothetical protein COB66_06700 [Coxiella sp. (in: Bacteria)]|nr:MAG: hypothetical protein COB66_06700 [Coxiella sp. (in: g-proteobacteria)]